MIVFYVRLLVLAALTCLSAGLSAASGEVFSDAELEQLSRQSGTEVTSRTEGATVIVEVKRGGVILHQQRTGAEISAYDNDASGLGAIKCNLGIYVAVRVALKQCFAGEKKALSDDIDRTIDLMEVFSADNAWLPTSRSDVKATWDRYEQNLDRLFGQQHNACRSSATQFVPLFERRTHQQREADVATLLSVPRPPATNPCL